MIISSNLKPSEHIKTITSKANKVLTCIGRTFSNLDNITFISLYKCLVPPLLEYASPSWSPYLLKDIHSLEGIQRRATKLVKSLSHLTYHERLVSLGLPSLLYRFDREDLILVYKIFSDPNHPLKHIFAPNVNPQLRGHSKKIAKTEHHSCLVRKHFFSQRVINNWNNLPNFVVEATDINKFKSFLNTIYWHANKFFNEFN